jgi:hypothetical protein
VRTSNLPLNWTVVINWTPPADHPDQETRRSVCLLGDLLSVYPLKQEDIIVYDYNKVEALLGSWGRRETSDFLRILRK